MVTLRFLPQAVLDAWVDQNKVDLHGDRLVDLATRAEFPLREALHFVKLEAGDDAAGVLNRVKPLAQIKEIGGELCSTSVLLGDAVYEVEAGWIAEDSGTAARSRPAGKQAERNAEAEALAQLLLGKMP